MEENKDEVAQSAPEDKNVEESTEGGEGGEEEDETDAEIEMMKARVAEMEAEAAKIEQLQNSVEKTLKPNAGGDSGFPASGPSIDARSVYVGNVDYSTEPEELETFFSSCGTVNRVTILVDKWTQHPKGFAYVEFKDAEAIVNAMILNETEFKGRPLKISPKRTNVPSFKRGSKGGKGGKGGKGAPGGYRPRGGAPPSYGYGRRPYRPRRYHPYY